MSEEEAFKLLGQALAALPGVVGLIVEGLALGHGDPVTRRKVADILPVDSASRAAQRALEPAAVAAPVPAELAPAVVVGSIQSAKAIDHSAAPPAGGSVSEGGGSTYFFLGFGTGAGAGMLIGLFWPHGKERHASRR